jgi:hypothetical protein
MAPAMRRSTRLANEPKKHVGQSKKVIPGVKRRGKGKKKATVKSRDIASEESEVEEPEFEESEATAESDYAPSELESPKTRPSTSHHSRKANTSSRIPLRKNDHIVSFPINAEDEDEEGDFPAQEDFAEIVDSYLVNLSIRKQDKALISQDMYDSIFEVLANPDDKSVKTPQFRFWVRKMFNLENLNGEDVITHEDRPVAVKEQIYQVIRHCHREAEHGGRDRTCAEIKKYYSWVPKELVAYFVKACPNCSVKRKTMGQVRKLSHGELIGNRTGSSNEQNKGILRRTSSRMADGSNVHDMDIPGGPYNEPLDWEPESPSTDAAVPSPIHNKAPHLYQPEYIFDPAQTEDFGPSDTILHRRTSGSLRPLPLQYYVEGDNNLGKPIGNTLRSTFSRNIYNASAGYHYPSNENSTDHGPFFSSRRVSESTLRGTLDDDELVAPPMRFSLSDGMASRHPGTVLNPNFQYGYHQRVSIPPQQNSSIQIDPALMGSDSEDVRQNPGSTSSRPSDLTTISAMRHQPDDLRTLSTNEERNDLMNTFDEASTSQPSDFGQMDAVESLLAIRQSNLSSLLR